MVRAFDRALVWVRSEAVTSCYKFIFNYLLPLRLYTRGGQRITAAMWSRILIGIVVILVVIVIIIYYGFKHIESDCKSGVICSLAIKVVGWFTRII